MMEDEPANYINSTLPAASSFVSKFDVLLTENVHGRPEYWEPGHHRDDQAQTQQQHKNVGNNRFRVLCKMHLTEFQYAKTEQEEEVVLSKLHKLVSQQCGETDCARSGKFLLLVQEQVKQEEQQETELFWLEHEGFSYRWTELPRERAYSFIRGGLELEMAAAAVAAAMPPASSFDKNNDDDIKKRRRRSSLLRRSVSSGDVFSEDAKKRIQQRKSVLRQSTIYLAQFLEGVDFEVSDDDDDDDDDGVRGNAPSAFHHSFPGVLPVSRPLYQRFGSWTADDDISRILQTADPLDVILRRTNTSTYELVPHHTGNNRVEVMIQLQSSKYAQLCENMGDAQSVCQDLVDTVRANYGGKFLVKRDEEDYRCLTDEQAIAALDSIFRTEAGLAPTTAPKITHSNNYSSSSSNNSQRNSFLQPLHPPPFQAAIGLGMVGGGDAHRTAREELQRRKKKRGLKSRLNHVVAKTGIGRAQSEGVRAGSSMSIPLPPQETATRYASTGMIGSATTAKSPTSDEKHPLAASMPAAMNGTDLRDLLLDDDVQQDIEPLEPTRRRSTLSAFSQGMIQDMLSRLDVSRDEDDLNVDHQVERFNHRPVEAAVDTLDFDLGPSRWDTSDQIAAETTIDHATVGEGADELDFQLTREIFEDGL